MSAISLLPSGLGIPQEDWERTPQSVRRALLMLYPSWDAMLAEPRPMLSIDEYDALIERGFGLLAGSDTVDDWIKELKQEHKRDDSRFDDQISTIERHRDY